MKNERLKINTPDGSSYDIVYMTNFKALPDEIGKIYDNAKDKKYCIITDDKVKDLYADEVVSVLKEAGLNCEVFSFKSGEESKNLDVIRDALGFLIEHNFKRDDVLIALGGGVTGDMTGFIAAVYLRGIDFIQVPTTLLSQVDSSIGGKTGVDYQGFKNMVGAFKMPKLVYTNLSVLDTLDGRQYYSGMAEVIKDALLGDEEFYVWLINNLYEIHDKEKETLIELVYKSNLIKKDIVERDPFEKGDRALLNLGHTLGHAIEKYKDFKLAHGECVALGTVCAAYISKQRKLITNDEYYEIRDMMVPFNLPITIDDIDPEKIVDLTANDKKAVKGGIKFVLLKKAGEAFLDTTVTREEMLEAVNEIYFSEEDEKE